MMQESNMWSALRLPCEGTISLEEVQANAIAHHTSETIDATVHRGLLFADENSTLVRPNARQFLRPIAEYDQLESSEPGPTTIRHSSASYPPSDPGERITRHAGKPRLASWPLQGLRSQDVRVR